MDEQQKSKKEELAKTFKFCLLNVTSASLNVRRDVFQQLTQILEHGGRELLRETFFLYLSLKFSLM